SKRVTIGDILNTIGLIILSAILLLPIVWAFLMSLKTRADVLSTPPKRMFVPPFEHYQTVWSDGSLLAYAKNSLIVTFAATAIGLLLGVPAAYALARLRFKGQRFLLLGILSTRMIPPVAFIVPFFVIFTGLGLKDTYT